MESARYADVGAELGHENGVLVDLGEEDAREVVGPPRCDWIRRRISRVMFGSDAVVAAAAAPYAARQGGLYFLVMHGKVVYVGQAACVGDRIQDHAAEGRPFEAAAIIGGIPKWARTEFEHAYVQAWNPPWNDESRRSGELANMPDLQAAARALDRTAVMPHYAPVLTSGGRYKAWQLHLIGYTQHLQREGLLPAD